MAYEEFKKAKLKMETGLTENWAYAYSISVFKKKHPQKANEYETRIFQERMEMEQGINNVHRESKARKTKEEKIKEIMSIEDARERHDAIAKNLSLFSRSFNHSLNRIKSNDYGQRTVAELQKRSEIMAIKDIDIRRKAIAENLKLFDR